MAGVAPINPRKQRDLAKVPLPLSAKPGRPAIGTPAVPGGGTPGTAAGGYYRSGTVPGSRAVNTTMNATGRPAMQRTGIVTTANANRRRDEPKTVYHNDHVDPMGTPDRLETAAERAAREAREAADRRNDYHPDTRGHEQRREEELVRTGGTSRGAGSDPYTGANGANPATDSYNRGLGGTQDPIPQTGGGTPATAGGGAAGNGQNRQDPPANGGGAGGGGGGATDPRTEFDDLRGQIISGSYNPQYEGEAVDLLRGANAPGFRSVATPDFSAAERDLALAFGPDFRGVALPDFRAAEGNVNEARIGPGMQIAGTNLDPARRTLQSATNRATGVSLADQERIDGGSYDTSTEAQRARALTMDALEKTTGGPSRSEIAAGVYDEFGADQERAAVRALREIGRKHATFGTLSSGMVNTDLADLGTAVAEADARERRRLGLDTADKELGDRIDRLGAARTTGSTFRGEDLDEAGMQQGLRNELRDERGFHAGHDLARAGLELQKSDRERAAAGMEADFAGTERGDAESDRAYFANREDTAANLALGRADRLADFQATGYSARANERDTELSTGFNNANLALSRAGQRTDIASRDYAARAGERDAEMDHGFDAAGLDLTRSGMFADMDRTRFAQESSLRDEQRFERGRADQLAQQAIDNRAREIELGEFLANSRFSRNADIIRLVQQTIAMGGNPEDALLQAARQEAANGGSGDIGAFLAEYARRRAATGGGSGGGGAVATTEPNHRA